MMGSTGFVTTVLSLCCWSCWLSCSCCRCSFLASISFQSCLLLCVTAANVLKILSSRCGRHAVNFGWRSLMICVVTILVCTR